MSLIRVTFYLNLQSGFSLMHFKNGALGREQNEYFLFCAVFFSAEKTRIDKY